MPRVEYSAAERQRLGLHKQRRRLAIKQPTAPPIIWIFGLTLLFWLLSLTTHQPVSIMGQTGASSTEIMPNGQVVQTTTAPDGHQTIFKVQNSGWPLTAIVTSCYGIAPDCKTTHHFNLTATIINLMAWFLIAVIIRVIYITYR